MGGGVQFYVVGAGDGLFKVGGGGVGDFDGVGVKDGVVFVVGGEMFGN